MLEEKVDYGFGPHLMLDCYDCPKEKLADVDFIFDTLDKFPDKIEMTKIMPPYVFKYKGKSNEEWGVSGVVLIAESHITIHTFPEQHHAFVDIFSCKAFDTTQAATYLIQLFEAKRHEIQLLNRGMDLPRDMRPGSDLVGGDRRTFFERPRLTVH